MPLVVVAGPTGTGKTALSLDLADLIAAAGGRAEIVNADAMQLYRGMDIGTAKIQEHERRGVPHHLFDLWAVTETASVAAYRDAARRTIEGIERRGAVPILVGGSGLYLEAVLRELAIPATDPQVRAALEAEAEAVGASAFHAALAADDPVAAARIPAGNVRRVVRAREVIRLTGRPYAASLPETAPWWRTPVRVVVDLPNDPLRAGLARRAEGMWAGGLLEETRGLLAEGLARGGTASRAVGYAQAIAVIEGRETREWGLAETIRLTWRVVRRQRGWFGRDEAVFRVRGDDEAAPAAVYSRLSVAPTLER